MEQLPKALPLIRGVVLYGIFTLILQGSLSGQFELESGVYNYLSQRVPTDNPSGLTPIGPNTPPQGTPTITPQFANIVESSGGSTSGVNGTPNTARVTLLRSNFGTTFASGVPRYFYGDTITPPKQIYSTAGILTEIADPETFWRTEPIRPGEILTNPSGNPPVDYRTGESVGIDPLPNGMYENYYYSPHAKRVFANTAGNVQILWRSSLPDANGNYVFYSEQFAVSSATNRTIRTIFWTEKGFNGPAVAIPSGNVEAVNPIYSNSFPDSVDTEYVVPGENSTNDNAELRTIWFEKLDGNGALYAYNLTGRLLVEYLGALQDDGSYQFLGLDIVSVDKSITSSTLTVNLGDEIRPFPDDPDWIASPLQDNSDANSESFYGTQSKSGGGLRYFAERENLIADKLRFFWLEPKGIEIRAASGAGDDVEIQWPIAQNKYYLVWPEEVEAYAHYTVSSEGSSIENGTGLSFGGNSMPEIVFQDGNAGDAVLDNASQRLLLDLNSDPDGLNRSLLKFNGSNGGVWYVRLYGQSEEREGYEEPDGGIRLQTIAYVGDRLEPPDGYTAVGFISEGTSFDPTSYINPFEGGFAQAKLGAIIPVNALPQGTSELTVRWFEKVPAPGSEFSSFYTASKVGRYTLAWPSNAPKIILASNQGTGPLSSPLSTASVYSQPDPNLQGYNPNEEHALMVSGRGYALRDDLNLTDGTILGNTEFSSEPFVLLRYTDPNDGRPAMQAFKVVRETDEFRFDYDLTAGTIVNAPMPLPLLPIPVDLDTNRVMNQEVDPSSSVQDPAINPNAPSSYDKFTYQGRKGYTWLYRGPHAGEPEVIARYSEQYQGAYSQGSVADFRDTTGFSYLWNENGPVGDASNYSLLLWNADNAVWTTAGAAMGKNPAPAANLRISSTQGIHPGEGTEQNGEAIGYAPIIAYTFSEGGTYDLDNAFATRSSSQSDMGDSTVTITVYVNDRWVATRTVRGGESANFNTRLGTVSAGDTVYIAINPGASGHYDALTLDFKIVAGAPAMGMQFYYQMREDFTITGGIPQPLPGTPLPYLRPIDQNGDFIGNATTGDPLTILYRPKWPETPPQLNIAETLGLSKRGLPALRGQSSTEILYQQSLALGTALPSTTLQDPTRAKSVLLDDATVGLDSLPASLKTDIKNGITYFQLAPPHLQQRFTYNPNLGTVGGLELAGEFIDALTGEDYYNLNTLSNDDVGALKGLVIDEDPDKQKWDTAIDRLSSTLETFIEDPDIPGNFIVNRNLNTIVGPQDLPVPLDSDTAVDSYALTATGSGTGFVTLVFGDGEAFTESGEPISLSVLRVNNELYDGDLKTLYASNPLDEQVTLRHSGDFAAEPGNYEFEWRYATAINGSAPAIISLETQTVLGNGSTNTWNLLSNPKALPSAFNPLDYASSETISIDPSGGYSLSINGPGFAEESTLPGRILKLQNDLAAQNNIESTVVFSIDCGNTDGFVLYVNNKAVLAFNVPDRVVDDLNIATTAARSGISNTGLNYQFELDASLFREQDSRIEVALYSSESANSSPVNLNIRLDITERVDLVTTGDSWFELSDGSALSNIVVLGGDASSPLGNPLLLFQDTFFTVRYRAADSGTVATGADWSNWTEPALVQSWTKRVLDGINPFDQRQTDLFNNPISTDVSILTQAGPRWEGDVALTLDNIDDFGLIEIYETMLNRVKKQSIDAGYDDSGVNQSLLLVAGYLADLYQALGDEAYDDAMNPTIRIDTSTGMTDLSSSRFAFEGQTATLLDETLALLRGRDDFSSPGTSVNPAYNRLYWNYTNGVNSGEPLYAMNYNIYENSLADDADGNLDANDAIRLYPQGHGDAYGHYLTALTGYYKLLTNTNFTWIPASESVDVLGQSVSVDYQDERKFAAAAAKLAKAGMDVLDFTARKSGTSLDSGWTSFSDLDTAGNQSSNPATGIARHWGVDDWASRVSQGSYFNWVVGNAMLPSYSPNEGIRKIDRTTVPELDQLATTAAETATLVITLQDHLNSLGLTRGAMAFDISPAEMAAGKTHFEQLYDRAVKASVNAKNAFEQASVMNHSLQDQAITLNDYITEINNAESAYDYELRTLLGTPYAGDMGPGKLYEQGYEGPDLYHWYYIDAPARLVETSESVRITVKEPLEEANFVEWSPEAAWDLLNGTDFTGNDSFVSRTYDIDPSTLYQFADSSLGKRAEPGELQQALRDVYLAQLEVRQQAQRYLHLDKAFERDYQLITESILTYNLVKNTSDGLQSDAVNKARAARRASVSGAYVSVTADYASDLGEAVKEVGPQSIYDFFASFRSSSLFQGYTAAYGLRLSAVALDGSAAELESAAEDLQQQAADIFEDFEFTMQFRELIASYEQKFYELIQASWDVEAATIRLQSATQRVSSINAEVNQLLADRESFRLVAATKIERYRTGDVLYRDFRNEFLSQYKSLYDLAQTYTYLAAQAFDYETGLLGTETGQNLLLDILSTYSLGEFSGETPVLSGLGDAGLASTLARLSDEYSIAKGRLGLNNPDNNGTLFSLRQELFRIKTDQSDSDDDLLWKQVLQQHLVSDLRNDPDVVNYCANLFQADDSTLPGIVIPFSTLIQAGYNFFGWPLAGGDHTFSQSAYATKIASVGVVFQGYVGMDPYAEGIPGASGPASSDPNALSATPYVYLIPAGNDAMLAPPLGGLANIRTWDVRDQALPLPLDIGYNNYAAVEIFTPQGSLADEFWIPRRHQAFRAVDDPVYFYSRIPAEYTSSRLIGRSVWNTQWKLVIPGYSLLNDEQQGLDTFIQSVDDIKLFFRTYSHSGN